MGPRWMFGEWSWISLNLQIFILKMKQTRRGACGERKTEICEWHQGNHVFLEGLSVPPFVIFTRSRLPPVGSFSTSLSLQFFFLARLLPWWLKAALSALSVTISGCVWYVCCSCVRLCECMHQHITLGHCRVGTHPNSITHKVHEIKLW